MSEKSIIIIGAGIAGLSAGCYTQMNGFDTEIYEMHTIPGGLCTAWKRKGFTFDGCIHWLTGSSPKNLFYKLWEALGMVQGKQFITYEYYTQAIDEHGNKSISYTNPDKLQEHMLSLSQKDGKLIKGIINDIKKLMNMHMPIDYGIGNLIKMLPMMRMFRKYSMPVSELASRFTNPVLKNLFQCAFDWHKLSAQTLFALRKQSFRTPKALPIFQSKTISHYYNYLIW